MPAYSGARLPLRLLHGWQQATGFSQADSPAAEPAATGIWRAPQVPQKAAELEISWPHCVQKGIGLWGCYLRMRYAMAVCSARCLDAA
jgi:hypothetical protein